MLSERLEVRVDPETMRLLREASDRRGLSIGELVRQAVTTYLEEDDRASRMAAAEELFAIEAPVDEWEVMEEEILSMYEEELP